METLIQHLRLVWCNNDETTFNKLLKYFKLLIKDPESLRDHALIVVGEAAVGKTIVFQLLKKVLRELYPDSIESNMGDITNFYRSKYQYFESFRYFEDKAGSNCANGFQCAKKMKTKLFIFSEANRQDLRAIFELAQLFHSTLLITSQERILHHPNDSSYFWELRCSSIDETEEEHQQRMNKIGSISTKEFIDYFEQIE